MGEPGQPQGAQPPPSSCAQAQRDLPSRHPAVLAQSRDMTQGSSRPCPPAAGPIPFGCPSRVDICNFTYGPTVLPTPPSLFPPEDPRHQGPGEPPASLDRQQGPIFRLPLRRPPPHLGKDFSLKDVSKRPLDAPRHSFRPRSQTLPAPGLVDIWADPSDHQCKGTVTHFRMSKLRLPKAQGGLQVPLPEGEGGQPAGAGGAVSPQARLQAGGVPVLVGLMARQRGDGPEERGLDQPAPGPGNLPACPPPPPPPGEAAHEAWGPSVEANSQLACTRPRSPPISFSCPAPHNCSPSPGYLGSPGPGVCDSPRASPAAPQLGAWLLAASSFYVE
ncbi:basic proline-rich protein-like [Lagenorhynchus albirostris]|uniref:basic proline-rich protein-like n=1 Tax=Lagenorhynchus albirostris TaxID=27610 RepID=UPI0028EE66C4|nr:basic proline-rich protein-like [Lagenorhynchus albirostris]